MLEIKKLPSTQWKVLKNLRLSALKAEPQAFGSSFEEEKFLTQAEWKRRTENTLFACINNEIAGMIVYIINNKLKQKHISNINGG